MGLRLVLSYCVTIAMLLIAGYFLANACWNMVSYPEGTVAEMGAIIGCSTGLLLIGMAVINYCADLWAASKEIEPEDWCRSNFF